MSSNKNKTTWNIKNLDTGTNFSNGDIQVLDIEGRPSYYQQANADAFNNFFFLQLTVTTYNTHNKIGTNKHISSTHLNFLSQISKNFCFLLWGLNLFQLKKLQM
jgi:hypothetical protein